MKKITVDASDGVNAYTLTRDAEANLAELAITGQVTPKLARDLIEDLQPLAGARKKKPPAPKAAAGGAINEGKDNG